MKRKICSLLIMAVLVCSLLTACGGSGGSVSGPNNSYSTKNDEISTKLSNMYTDYTKTGSGDRVITGSGSYWDYTYYYKLHIDVVIKNTGNVTANIDNSLFSAYWDDEKLTPYNSDIKPVQLLPGEQTTVELKYHIDRNKYNSWYSKGHNITILIQYGGDSLAYVYSTTTDEVTVVQ